MAIIIEEEKKTSNLTNLLGIVAILATVAVGAYYLFFVSVPPSIITPPAGFNDITPITQITFNPQSVVGSAAFTSLKQSIPEPTSTSPAAVGRTDPFLAP
jgi:hypothetical protein